MFVQIGNQRIKISSIGRYRDMGFSQSKKQYRVEIKISNVWENFYFNTEKEKNDILSGLDNVLKLVRYETTHNDFYRYSFKRI